MITKTIWYLDVLVLLVMAFIVVAFVSADAQLPADVPPTVAPAHSQILWSEVASTGPVRVTDVNAGAPASSTVRVVFLKIDADCVLWINGALKDVACPAVP